MRLTRRRCCQVEAAAAKAVAAAAAEKAAAAAQKSRAAEREHARLVRQTAEEEGARLLAANRHAEELRIARKAARDLEATNGRLKKEHAAMAARVRSQVGEGPLSCLFSSLDV